MIRAFNGPEKSSTSYSIINRYVPLPQYARSPSSFSSYPPQQPFVFQQGNRNFPVSPDLNRISSQRVACSQAFHGQNAVHYPQCMPLEVEHRNRYPPLQNLKFRPPDQRLASIETAQRSAAPKAQRDHCSPQHLNPPSKRQKRPELGGSDDRPDAASSTYKNPLETWSSWEAQNYVYKPEANEDPFKHSRSLRHQQPANRRKQEDDKYSDTPLDDAQDDGEDSDLGDELGQAEREGIAYKELLPRVKQLVLDIGVNEKWPHDREEKMCMVCNVPIMRLKGWKALLQHAESFQKRKPVQHRAYFRVLSEILKQKDLKLGEAKAVLIESVKPAEEVIVWPPVVVIDNIKDEEYLDMCLLKLKPSDIQRSFRFSKKGRAGVGRMLVVFPASEVGHLNSKVLVDGFAKFAAPASNSARLSEFPRDQLLPLCPPPPPHLQHRQGFGLVKNRRVEMARSCTPLGHMTATHCNDQQDQESMMVQQQQRQPLKVFLARATDMQQMDPKRKLLKWSIENQREILKCVLKKSKEEHELEKAKVKAKLVEVDRIAESHQQFKSRKAILSQQLKDAEMALKLQKDREGQIAWQHAEQLHLMDKVFKEEVRRLEFERKIQEARLQQRLEANERQLEKERVERSTEVEFLLEHLENVNQELRNHTAQKALEKERDISRRREVIYNEIKRREANFNEEGRNLEKNLLEKQESEKIKFLAEYNTMRQEFLDEWVAKQAALKEKAEKAKQEKETLMKLAASNKESVTEGHQARAECSICFEEFDDNTKRALIQPCGHAKTCLPCAVELFSQGKLCPICRVKMSSKPKAIPYKLFM